MIKVLYIGWEASGGEKSFREALTPTSDICINYLTFNIGTSYYFNGKKINSYPRLLDEIERSGPYHIIHVGNPLVADINGGGFQGIINRASKNEVDPKIVSTIHSLFPFELTVDAYSYEEVKDEDILKKVREKLFFSKDDTRAKSQQEIMEKSDVIVVPSQFYRSAISYLYPEYEEKVTIIPNGSDIYQYKNGTIEKKEENDKGRKEFKILYHGRITPLKGLRELCYAVKKFNEEFSPKIRILMTGKYYTYSFLKELEDIANGYLSYLGNMKREELIKVILESDLIVQPTYHDSFNLSTLEGLMLGKKVITSYTSSMPELWIKPAYAVGALPNPHILGRENEIELHCIIDSKYFTEALKNTLRYVLIEGEYTSKSSQDIQEEVKERYNEKKMQELYRDLYFSLL
jgi:glycosyltransferase involved in cell wall biosynthesis